MSGRERERERETDSQTERKSERERERERDTYGTWFNTFYAFPKATDQCQPA